MKKILLFFVCVATAVSVGAAPKKVDFDKLPANSQEYIRDHFANQTVKSVEMDRESSWDKYTVYFNDGSQVSFHGGSGYATQIMMKNGAVPAAAIPARVRDYAMTNYPGLRVVSWESTADGHRVRLSDNTYVDFDDNGNFKKAER